MSAHGGCQREPNEDNKFVKNEKGPSTMKWNNEGHHQLVFNYTVAEQAFFTGCMHFEFN
jgi:hypothetical protein